MSAHLNCIAIFCAILSPAIGRLSIAQDPLTAIKPYDGIQAGLDAYRLGEEKRQGAVNQQIFQNDQLRFWNGYPTSRGESIYNSTIYYGYMSPAALAAYGYGPYEYSGFGTWTGFQPGPWMGGGLWGPSAYYQPARQPIGQQQIQIGPNHWESHPVYDPPITAYNAQPPVASQLLDRTPYATPAAATPVIPGTTFVAPAAKPQSLLQAVDSVPPPPPPAASPAPAGPREY